MAIYDNKHWLLSHIRNSFISTDDTGMCEMVMANEDFPKQLPKLSKFDTYPGFDDSTDEDDMDDYNDSFDIHFNYFDNGAYRQRSNTAQHLEKMNIARKKAAKIKNIKWEPCLRELTQDEKDELFTKKIDYGSKTKAVKNDKYTSLLTEQILKTANLPNNPFIEYSKFDGCARVGIQTKKFKIFMTMLPESERNYPLPICIIATARIQDLIGLTLLKYTMSHNDYNFKSVSHYGLFITEDDGEVEGDFPALDPRECVAKFCFSCLGLVEYKHHKSTSFESNDTSGLHKDSLDSPDDKPMLTKPRQSIQNPEDLEKLYSVRKKMEAPTYQSYRVHIVNKVRAKTEVQLGISGEKIEIDPIQQKNTKFWVRQKAVSYQMDSIAWCEVLDSKSNRTTFRLVYSLSHGSNHPSDTGLGSSHSPMLQASASFKHHDFETDQITAEEIVRKINHILELRSSTSRKEYLLVRERKLNKKRNFPLK